jgi:hypothetical protein
VDDHGSPDAEDCNPATLHFPVCHDCRLRRIT